MKHEFKVIPKEEILSNRSNAYEFIDFDKKETLEEAAKGYAEANKFLSDRPFEFNRDLVAFINGAKWQEQKTIEEVFEWLTTNNYLTDLKETLIENFKKR